MKSHVDEYGRDGVTIPTMKRVGIVLSGRRVIHLRDLLLTLVSRDMKLRYKRSILGVAWSLLTPLVQLAVFFVTFSVLLPLNIPNYASSVFIGVLAWNWFQGGTFQATTVIVENRDLLRRPGFPVAILPIVTVTSYLIHFVLGFPVLLAFLAWDGVGLTSAVLALPLVIVIQFMLTLGLAYIVSTLYVTFHDTQHLLGVFLNLLFFLTPVFYKASNLPSQYQALYRLNPLADLIESYRVILLTGTLPHGVVLLRLIVLATGSLLLGYYFFRKSGDYFVDQT